ncbi:MAG: hypothetical protein ACQESR_11575, partial [Planctomycetota bacterium]
MKCPRAIPLHHRAKMGLILTVIFAGVIFMAWWNMIRMPGKSHGGPLPPANDQLASLADELRQHVSHLARELSERNVMTSPDTLAAA